MSQAQQKSNHTCVFCHVAGLVQGVFFRASTQKQAQMLGLTGYAHNLPNGQVEVLACGDPDAIVRMRQWLAVGPATARVTATTCETVPMQAVDGFSIR